MDESKAPSHMPSIRPRPSQRLPRLERFSDRCTLREDIGYGMAVGHRGLRYFGLYLYEIHILLLQPGLFL